MKKKFSLWLNIVTICLCMCAIAIGVYAATSASLTVSGKIGFSAHGVDLAVTGTIEGHAVKDGSDDINGTPSTAVPLPNATFEKGVGSMDMGSRFFTDLTDDGNPADIIIRLSVTNNSPYAITGTAGTHTLPSNVTATVEPASVEIAKDATQPFVITLSITATNGNYANITSTPNNTQINMTFEKYVAPPEPTIRDELSIADNKIWVNMGQDFSGNDLRWYAIAYNKDGTGAEQVDPAKYTTLKAGVDYTDVSQIPAGNYIFISEYILPEASGDNFMLFNSNFTQANDYGIHYNGSTVQQYLSDEEAETGTIFTTYNISQTAGFYAEYINQVDLAGEAPTNGHSGKENFKTTDTADQKLWLLSDEEYKAFFGNGDSSGIGSILGGSDFMWWLRSPEVVEDRTCAYAYYVSSYGSVSSGDVSLTNCGVRAAFQITIA